MNFPSQVSIYYEDAIWRQKEGKTNRRGPPLEKKQIFSNCIATLNVLYYRISVVWVLIRKPYKTPNKKENRPKAFPRDYLWTLGKGVL